MTFNIPNLKSRLNIYLSKRRLNYALKILIESGIKINVVYDIGARHAEWAKSIYKILQSTNIILFEANEKCKKFLEMSHFKYFIDLLSSDIRTIPFYENNTTGDSYFKELTSCYAEVEPIMRQTSTLNKIISDNNLPLPDLIKIDTQGSELDILRGGSLAVNNASLIYLECPIIKYNDGAPNFLEYISYLDSINFEPYDICELHQANGILIQVDILFKRKF